MRGSGLVLLLACLLFRALGVAADFAPDIKTTKVPGELYDMVFLGDESILALGKETHISYDNGDSWATVDAFKNHEVGDVYRNPYIKSMAVISMEGHEHFITVDSGKTWSKFGIYSSDKKPIKEWVALNVQFNSVSSEYVGLEFMVCSNNFCSWQSFVSKDGLKTVKQLPKGFANCIFARANPDFDSSIKPETLVCSKEETNSFGNVLRTSLHRSDDFFDKSDTVIDFPGSKDKVIMGLLLESSFFLVYLKGDRFAKAKNTMIVSKDLKTFDVANFEFQDNHEEGNMWIISATPSRLVFAVPPKGSELLGSDLYITDSTGLKVSLLAEAGSGAFSVSPAAESLFYSIEQASKSLINASRYRSSISFDSGKTWQKLEVLNDPDCELKAGCSLHRLPQDFSKTPNIIASNGVKGEYADFLDRKDGDLYVSRDGGATWTFSLKGSHVINYLDQGNILVAWRDQTYFPVSEINFSLNQGLTWSTVKLEQPIAGAFSYARPKTSDSKFYIYGLLDTMESAINVIDFKNAFDGAECSEQDLESVPVYTPKGFDEFCSNGHKDKFTRRKQDAKCLVRHLAEEVSLSEEPCECSAFDHECSPNFELSAKDACVPIVAKIAEVCKGSNKKIKLPSHQKKAGNQCVMNKKKESDFVQEVEFNCKDIKNDHQNEETKPKINVGISKLEGTMQQYSYVKSSNFSDNILLLTNERTMFASNNGGQSFVVVPLPDDVLFFLVGEVESTAIIVTEKHLYYSQNGGNAFQQVSAPDRPNNRGLPIVFHPSDPKKFVFISNGATTGGFSGSKAYYTEDAGVTFTKLLDNVLTCGYVDKSLGLEENLLYCNVIDGPKTKLVSSKNYFKDSTELFDSVLAFAVKPGFVFVALVGEDSRSLMAKVTVDGQTFADADFPNNFQLDEQTAYTILDSSSHSILMHVTTDRKRGEERGALLKSNSNGTSYVLTLEEVNRNELGFVDFDRIEILEGTYIANTVQELIIGGGKNLKTRISHNDGGLWEFLAPPQKDSAGNEYECVKRTKGQKNALARCSLNLRSFTERPDFKDTFSSTSAAGYLFGVGDVGEFLQNKDLATFMTSDGGVTWKEVAKGAYMWEFGDRGSIFVMVKEKEPTTEILYSTDGGKTWNTFQFSDTPIRVLDLATVPSDTSRQFIILGESKQDARKTLVVSIDFSNYFPRQCQLDLDHPMDDDYEYWTPKLPGSSDNCIFGHVSQYLRRAEGHYDCFIGAAPLENGTKRTQNCACTVKDYECDYNYFRDIDGTCKLVPGLSPQDHKKQMCSKPDTFQYFEPTGYRKLPSSTCVGGKELDSFNPQACPGHEKEFNEKHGRNLNFGKLLVLLVVPLAAFFGATWFVYERGVKRNGGLQRLGQIRLEEANDFDPIEENNTDKVVNGIVKGGILVVAGTIATVKTLRKLDRKMLENITGLLFGRRPGRRNYVRVPDDEDELFGDYDDNYNDEDDLGDVDFQVDDDPTDLGDDFAVPSAAVDANLFDIDDENTAESGTSDSER